MNKLIKNKKNILREFNEEKYRIAYKNFSSKRFKISNIDKFFYKNKIEYKRLLGENKIMNSFIHKFSKDSENIIDLGSGYGCRSIPLIKKRKFNNKKFYFFDIAPYAIKLLKLILKNLKINNRRVVYSVWDFYNKKFPKKKLPTNSLIFTSYSLIYRKKLNSVFLKNILSLKPRIVIHFEPIFEYNLKNKMTKKYILENNYSINLLSLLKKFEKMRKIEIIKTYKNVFGARKYFPFSIIIWKRVI